MLLFKFDKHYRFSLSYSHRPAMVDPHLKQVPPIMRFLMTRNPTRSTSSS